jgi:hypothetical protein
MSSQNDIEGRFRKGRICRVTLHKVDIYSRRPCFGLRQPNHVARNVYPGDPVALFGKKDREASRSTTEIRNPHWLFWQQRGQECQPGGTNMWVSETVIGLVIEGSRVVIPQLFNI